MEIYHTIYKGGDGEIVEKKSRFIAEVHPVTSEEEAMENFRADKKAVLGCETSLLGLHYRKESGGRKNE